MDTKKRDTFAIMHAPMHAPSVRLRHIRHMFRLARDHDVVSIGMTEAYNALGYLLAWKLTWRVIRGKSKTDTRRGPKDNPIVLRRRYNGRRVKVLARWTFKAHGPSEPVKLAPERWVTAVLFMCWDGSAWLKVLHVAVHPNAAVMNAAEGADRRVKFQQFWSKVFNLVEDVRQNHGPLRVVLSGDVNATREYDQVGFPAWVVAELKLEPWWSRIDLIATGGLATVQREKVDVGENGQDHPWMIATVALQNYSRE